MYFITSSKDKTPTSSLVGSLLVKSLSIPYSFSRILCQSIKPDLPRLSPFSLREVISDITNLKSAYKTQRLITSQSEMCLLNRIYGLKATCK